MHVRSQRRLDIVENPGMNLAQNWADPMLLAPIIHFSKLSVSPCYSDLRISLLRFHHALCGHAPLLSHHQLSCKRWDNPSVFAVLAVEVSLLSC